MVIPGAEEEPLVPDDKSASQLSAEALLFSEAALTEKKEPA
jgi:hypothetical protein